MSDATPSHTTMTRRELFDLVWSKPMSTLVRDYGITDVGMVKICKKHDIPRPPQGYWLRAKSRRGRRPRLPHVGAELGNVRVPVRRDPSHVADREAEPLLADEDAAALLAAVDALDPIRPRESLRGAHRLARELSKPIDWDWRSAAPRPPRLDVRVSKSLLRRAQLIYDAVLRALGDLDITPQIQRTRDDAEYVFKILGGEFRLSLREKHRHATAAELEGINRNKSWRSRRELVPTGRLELTIETVRWGPSRTWRDTERRAVEQVLHQVPRELVRIAITARGKRRVREDEQRQAAERDRARRDAAERAAREQARVEQLWREAGEWRDCNNLRAYIDEVESRLRDGGDNRDHDVRVRAWLAWANRVADGRDPVLHRVSEIKAAR